MPSLRMPSLRISKPGFYPDMTAENYHADPCPVAALSQSCVKTIMARSPWHAFTRHPRLNPTYEPSNDKKFDVGNVAHKLMLGRGKEICALPFDDWRSKLAKEGREAALADGRIPCLEHQLDRATDMVIAARQQLGRRGLDYLFAPPPAGEAELVMCWREGALTQTDGDTWFKQMLDWYGRGPNAEAIVADYKTTDLAAAPENLGRMMVNAGWHIQAAMAQRGLNVLADGMRRYLFVVQEAQEPFALCVVEIGEGPLTVGRKSIDMAADIWRDCMATGRWPGYPEEIITPEMPGWFEQQTLDREIAEESKRRMNADFGSPSDLVMAG